MSQKVIDLVQDKYGAVARSGLSSGHTGVKAVAEAFGYSPQELEAIPAEANMGLSCGNPLATARLRPGEVVVDLGCGGGLDVLLASPKVGPTGRVIGIDMTPDMIDLAKANAAKAGITNSEFHLARIDDLPLADGSVDCLISNCVINLAPDKGQVFREMYRVLKPGGRVAVSDIALKQPLPAEIGQNLLAYVGCVAGALLVSDYERMLKDAGFSDVQIVDTRKDLNVYAEAGASGCCSSAMTEAPTACCSTTAEGQPSSCCTPPEEGFHDSLGELLKRYNVNDYAASVQVYALKR